jgi:hypothetical protein
MGDFRQFAQTEAKVGTATKLGTTRRSLKNIYANTGIINRFLVDH